jgi:hypothetical protein
MAAHSLSVRRRCRWLWRVSAALWTRIRFSPGRGAPLGPFDLAPLLKVTGRNKFPELSSGYFPRSPRVKPTGLSNPGKRVGVASVPCMAGFSLMLQCVFWRSSWTLLALLSVTALRACVYPPVPRGGPRIRRPLLPDEALPNVLVQLPCARRRRSGAQGRGCRVPVSIGRRTGSEIQLLDDWLARVARGACAKRSALSFPMASSCRSCAAAPVRASRRASLALWPSALAGPFVAIFDADFVPAPDFLRRTIPALVADSGPCLRADPLGAMPIAKPTG